MRHIDYGLSVFRSTAFSGWPDNQAFDLAAVLQGLLVAQQLEGFEVDSRFYEIGSAGIEETERFILTRKSTLPVDGDSVKVRR
jgi:hypothetical protein